ncbi:MAG: trypsin-like serine peptidase [Oceanococcus sp.]
MSFPTTQTALAVALLLSSLSTSTQAQTWDSPWLSRVLLDAIPSQTIEREITTNLALAPSTALDYAQSVQTDISSTESGSWTIENGQATWRLKLHSPDAHNLSITLSELNLAKDASLRLYDAQGELWHGPISAAKLTGRDRFWSAIVPGEYILLELSQPSDATRSSLRVSSVHHGTTSWDSTAKSGSCNVDVACSSADSWTDAVRATARITIGGRRLCSAVLLNNTLQDGTPLLLTAKHCGIEESADMGAGSVVVYWNYESSQCGGSANGNLRQQQSGGTLLAEGSNADFSLIRLDSKPLAQYGVYYAGWDSRALAPTSGASVHHPSGDEKRISFYQQNARARSANVDGNSVASWEVFWDQGITEAGSSGAGLWNSQHRIVGQLSGGNSSCSQPDASDVFGRLDAAWEASSSPAGQLKTWLDAGQTGRRSFDGLDSRNTTASATTDRFQSVPQDSQLIRLDVLSNDTGAQPLRLIGAQAENGLVQLNGQQLSYQFPPDATSDTIEYQFVDRWGTSANGTVLIDKPEKTIASVNARGGSLGILALLLLLPTLRCRCKSTR